MPSQYQHQHDDHCWLNVNGEGWAIRQMRWPVIWLWRGYWPNIEYSIVQMENVNVELYCAKAVARLYDQAVA